MNKQKVIKAIATERARKEGKIPPHSCSPDSEIDWMVNAIEALEEIASVRNSLALRDAISLLSRNPSSTIHSRDIAERLSKIRGMIQSIQVPKEIVYAYPVTMHRHFIHYTDKFDMVALINDYDSYDEFGCLWRNFIAPKEAVDYLRENNVPIKVIE